MRARQFNVMKIVAEDSGLSQNDLSVMLGFDPTIMVALVDGLEHRGFLQRQRSQIDRRRYELQLTDAGRLLLKRAATAIDAAETDLFAPLSGEEIRTLKLLAARLLAPNGKGKACLALEEDPLEVS